MKNMLIRFLLKRTDIDNRTFIAMLQKLKSSATEQDIKYYWEKYI